VIYKGRKVYKEYRDPRESKDLKECRVSKGAKEYKGLQDPSAVGGYLRKPGIVHLSQELQLRPH
jgi:hypothetical protein